MTVPIIIIMIKMAETITENNHRNVRAPEQPRAFQFCTLFTIAKHAKVILALLPPVTPYIIFEPTPKSEIQTQRHEREEPRSGNSHSNKTQRIHERE